MATSLPGVKRSFGKISFKYRHIASPERVPIDKTELQKFESVCIMRRKLNRLLAKIFDRIISSFFFSRTSKSKLSKLSELVLTKQRYACEDAFGVMVSVCCPRRKPLFVNDKYGTIESSLIKSRKYALHSLFRIFNSRVQAHFSVALRNLEYLSMSCLNSRRYFPQEVFDGLFVLENMLARRAFEEIKEASNIKNQVYKFFTELKGTSAYQTASDPSKAFALLCRVHVFHFTKIHEAFARISGEFFHDGQSLDHTKLDSACSLKQKDLLKLKPIEYSEEKGKTAKRKKNFTTLKTNYVYTVGSPKLSSLVKLLQVKLLVNLNFGYRAISQACNLPETRKPSPLKNRASRLIPFCCNKRHLSVDTQDRELESFRRNYV